MEIEIKNLSFAYKEKNVLNNINLSFKTGKIYGLLGLNGSGKTTLLKLILGLLNEMQGTILINEKNKMDFKEDEIAKYIAYVPQSLDITYDISVLDFILMGFNPFLRLFEKPNKNHELQAIEQLYQMNLSHLVSKSLISLSGGELQMILIARALIQNTEFIIMDEPVSNLDLKNQRYVLDKIQEVSRVYKKAIIITLHDPNLIKKYCDEAILIKDGEVISHGASTDIINRENLKRIFNMPFEKIRTTDGSSYFIGGKLMIEKYFNIIDKEIESGKTICEAFIVEVVGTTPRGVGTSMLIKADGSIEGTIGGGQLEYKVIQEALSYIEKQTDGTKEIISYKDNEKTMEIISKVKVFFKIYLPKAQIVIFGGGHVANNLYELALKMNFSVILLDEREGFLDDEKYLKATKLIKRNILDAINENLITSKTYVVVASSSHKSDEEILKRVIKYDCKYIGMLGSKQKVAGIFKNLTDSGIMNPKLEKVYAPIGLDIGGENPEEVALSIISEIVSVKNDKVDKLKHMKGWN